MAKGRFSNQGCFVMLIFTLLLIAVCLFLATAVIFYGWNWVIAPIFHTLKITWLQAFVLQIFLWLVGGFFKATVSKK